MHIRGTPASGKSTLAHLLHHHVRKTTDIRVFAFSWPTGFPEPLTVHSAYHELLNSAAARPLHVNDWFDKPLLLIIDEAQGSYPYVSLWNDLIKYLEPQHRVYVALFTSYGSPASNPVPNLTPTPVRFRHSQRVSLRRTPSNPEIGLFFSRQEFDEVVDGVSRYYGQHGQLFLLAQDLQDYVWEMTSGHASAVRALLDGVACSDVRRSRTLASCIYIAD